MSDAGPPPDAGLVDSIASDGGAPEAVPRPDAGLPGGFDLNDVSFLYPLPSWDEREQLLGLGSAGTRGPLLSRRTFELLPPLVAAGDVSQANYDTIRIVAVRVDPCFPAPAPGGCVRQVRLVAQPFSAAPPLDTVDAAIHLLYDLDADAWEHLVRRLAELKALAGGATTAQPLGVHPVMKREGLKGAYARALNEMILEHASEETLSKVALMLLVRRDLIWHFQQLEPSDTGLVGMAIPRLGTARLQSLRVLFAQEASVDAPRKLLFEPAAPPDDFAVLTDTGSVQTAPLMSLTAGLRAALALERPGDLNPRTADCASCHVATFARGHAERLRAVDTRDWPERFRHARFDLRRIDDVGDDPRNLRAFGYFGTKSAISQRVINESAVVAEAISGR